MFVIYLTYSVKYLMQTQDENKLKNIWKLNTHCGTVGRSEKDFWLVLEKYGKELVFFSTSTKELCNVEGAWYPPTTVSTMVHSHAFLIITGQPHRDGILYPTSGHVLSSRNCLLHQQIGVSCGFCLIICLIIYKQ